MRASRPADFAPIPRFTPDQVREARRLLGWRQVDLALKAGIAAATLNRLETGSSVRVLTKSKIAAALVIAGATLDPEGGVALLRKR